MSKKHKPPRLAVIAVRVNADLARRVDDRARIEDRSRSQILRAALKFYLGDEKKAAA